MVENRHYPSSSTSLPSPVIHSGFIHVKHKAMNEKPCEAERRRGEGGERISCYQGNRHHGNHLINELVMNPSSMALVKSCCSNYRSFIHAVLAGAAQRSPGALTDRREQAACWIQGRRARAWERAPALLRASSPGPGARRAHGIQSIPQPPCQRAARLAPCHRHGQHHKQSADCRSPCYAFSLQKMILEINK